MAQGELGSGHTAAALPAVTVSLSGGGAKCAAQAGALEVLEEAGVEVAAMVGVSAGGLVAVLHALGWEPHAIRDFVAEVHLLDVWEVDFAHGRLLSTDKTRARLDSAVGDRTFADLALPVSVVAVDLDAGQEVYISSGRLDDALLATMAIPGLFAPLCVEGRRLVDGALLNPLPLDIAQRWGRPVVALDVLAGLPPPGTSPQFFEAQGPLGYVAGLGQRLGLMCLLDLANRAVLITTGRLRDYNLNAFPPAVLIQPDVASVGMFAFDLAEHAYAQGQSAARAALPRLAALSAAEVPPSAGRSG
jgi:NTE family protein